MAEFEDKNEEPRVEEVDSDDEDVPDLEEVKETNVVGFEDMA